MTAPADYPEASAVILFDFGDMDVAIDAITVSYHTRIKILTEAGKDEAGDVEISYDKEYWKLSRFKAHTITPSGTKHKVEKDAVFKKVAGDFETVTFAFPALQAGCIVEYQYELRKTEQFYYLRPWYFQNRLYTVSSEYRLRLAPGFSYNLDYCNIPPHMQKPTIEERIDPRFGGNLKTKDFRWELKNLMPITEEPYMSCVNDYRMALRFQLDSYRLGESWADFARTWKEVGQTWDKWLLDYNNASGDIERIVRETTQGIDDPRERARALHRYVTAEIRTMDALIGNQFQHEHASDLLKQRTGTATEKNILLSCLLKAAEVPSWPVLISTRGNSRFNPRHADLRQFNYALTFAQFGDDWEFLDASNPLVPFGVLPPKCLTDGGFLIDGEESDLVRITTRPFESMRLDSTTVWIAEDGTARCSTCCRCSGYCAASMAESYRTTDIDDFYDESFVDPLSVPCEITAKDCGLDSSGVFAVDLAYRTDGLCRKLDDNLVLRPPSYEFRSNPFKNDRRFFPVDFAYPFTYRNVVTVVLSDTTWSAQLLPDTLLPGEGVQFTRTCRRADSTLVVESELRITEPLFPAKDYRLVRSFFGNVARLSEDELVVALGGD